MPQQVSPRPKRRRRRPPRLGIDPRQLLAVATVLCFVGVAWFIPVRVADRNPPLEWTILSLRFGGPLAAAGILLGSLFRSLGPSLAVGFALWNGLLLILAAIVELTSHIRFR